MKKELAPWLWGSIAGAFVIVVTLLDWLTGYEMNFLVFYFLPVSLGAWFLGLGAMVILACFSAIMWLGADFLSGHTYSYNFYVIWNTTILLVSFLLIGYFVYKIRHLLDHEREITKALSRSLAEIKVLETILPICAQCKKIRNKEGKWKQLEVYIGEHSNTVFSHGYCPECAQKALEEAGLIDEKAEQGDGEER